MEYCSIGSKRIRRCSTHYKGGYYTEKDRISLLPDDIIILILSYLNLKDSVVTSTLSRKWRHMWTWAGRLDFVAQDWMQRHNAHTVKKRCNKFFKEVNRILRLHKPSTLEELSISFDLNAKFSHRIDKWLKFAIAKKVQRLKLDFQFPIKWDGGVPFSSDYDSKPYMLSCGRLGQTNGTSVGFESLKVLCLCRVIVTQEVLDGFLSSCPSLEKLSIIESGLLKSFKVCDPSLVLKDLEISNCWNLTSVEICNTNLATLTYRGREIRLVLRDAPMLIELTILCRASWYLDLFTQLSCCLPQLETLTLEAFRLEGFEVFNMPLELSNLKKLVFRPFVWCRDVSFLGCTTFIKASPHLKKFVFQIRTGRSFRKNNLTRVDNLTRVENFQHQHIEEVELHGYRGRISDLELVTFFLDNVVSLKKILVDTHLNPIGKLDVNQLLREEEAAKRRTLRQLEGKIRQGIQINIL